jgi:3-oxoadipate enol-lactonase/4-carboxymuconolactone decarboxylase
MTTLQLTGSITPARNGAADAPLVVLGPALGTTTALWARVADTLADGYRVLRYDIPGHGASPATRERFSIGDVADGVLRLVDAIGGAAPFHVVGISFGGTVGLELALNRPDRLASLAVVCSAAKIGTTAGWLDRAGQVRAGGVGVTVAGSASRWFAPGFIDRDPLAEAGALNTLLTVDDESYALCCEALAAFDVTTRVHRITTRTLCVSGELDLPTPAAQVMDLAAQIPDAWYRTIEGAGHLTALEAPDVLAAMLLEHLRISGPS